MLPTPATGGHADWHCESVVQLPQTPPLDEPPLLDEGPPPLDEPPLLDEGPPPLDEPPLLDEGPPPLDEPPLLDEGPPLDEPLLLDEESPLDWSVQQYWPLPSGALQESWGCRLVGWVPAEHA